MAKKKKQKVVPCTDVHQHDRERAERKQREKAHIEKLKIKRQEAIQEWIRQHQIDQEVKARKEGYANASLNDGMVESPYAKKDEEI
jgi:hypothetical protein